MSGTEGITIVMPEMGPVDAMASFFGDLAQIGAFILIVIAMGAVANERERGISAWVLTRPVGRQPTWSKFAAYTAGFCSDEREHSPGGALYCLPDGAPLWARPSGAPSLWCLPGAHPGVTLGASACGTNCRGRSRLCFPDPALAAAAAVDQTGLGKYMPYRSVR